MTLPSCQCFLRRNEEVIPINAQLRQVNSRRQQKVPAAVTHLRSMIDRALLRVGFFLSAPTPQTREMHCLSGVYSYFPDMAKARDMTDAMKSGIIEMALSDHASYSDIKAEYGLNESEVKDLMRRSLKPGSYKAWRKRVRQLSDRRERYK